MRALPEAEPLVVSADRDPANRRLDRLLAKLGLLAEAAPLFRDGERLPRTSVLLALPAIAQSGVVDTAREVYGSIGRAFYGHLGHPRLFNVLGSAPHGR